MAKRCAPPPSLITLEFENAARDDGYRFIAGVDEVGRGALAGPVVAAAAILDRDKLLSEGLNDSKKLSREERERISAELKESCLAFAFGAVEADEIDRINILRATHKAMLTAIEALKLPTDFLLIDALKLDSRIAQNSIIRGDSVSASIAAASVLAKVFRDDLMRAYDETYPVYNFKSHVGYGTAAHLAAIREHGACPLHRRSFRGVLN